MKWSGLVRYRFSKDLRARSLEHRPLKISVPRVYTRFSNNVVQALDFYFFMETYGMGSLRRYQSRLFRQEAAFNGCGHEVVLGPCAYRPNHDTALWCPRSIITRSRTSIDLYGNLTGVTWTIYMTGHIDASSRPYWHPIRLYSRPLIYFEVERASLFHVFTAITS